MTMRQLEILVWLLRETSKLMFIVDRHWPINGIWNLRKGWDTQKIEQGTEPKEPQGTHCLGRGKIPRKDEGERGCQWTTVLEEAGEKRKPKTEVVVSLKTRSNTMDVWVKTRSYMKLARVIVFDINMINYQTENKTIETPKVDFPPNKFYNLKKGVLILAPWVKNLT